MSKALYENLLKKFKKSNKIRRQYLAEKNGYKTANEYKGYLDNMITEGPTSSSTENIPTIHIVDILDCSSSMGNKVRQVQEGVNENIKALLEDTSVNYTHSYTTFDSSVSIETLREKVTENTHVNLHAKGMTALLDAIGFTLAKFENIKNDKILVNVYTDGGENVSRSFRSSDIRKLINQDPERIVVTFMGTKHDVNNVQSLLNIDDSNTVIHDNTSQGMYDAVEKTKGARLEFSASVSAGRSVSKGFYKNFK